MDRVIPRRLILEHHFYHVSDFSLDHRSQYPKIVRLRFPLGKTAVCVFTIKCFLVFTTDSVWS
jgi:hypothetical protein